jgi:hypothetical protein
MENDRIVGQIQAIVSDVREAFFNDRKGEKKRYIEVTFQNPDPYASRSDRNFYCTMLVDVAEDNDYLGSGFDGYRNKLVNATGTFSLKEARLKFKITNKFMLAK